MKNESMLGKWDRWYKNVKNMGSFRYGDTITYKLAADFLKDMEEVEDWGCGAGGFRKYFGGKCTGIDGSANPFVDKIADLCEYRSNVEGIVIRHVLEHNNDWKNLLANAIASFNKKLCIIIFTPWSEDKTKVIKNNRRYGVDVPDISFARGEIEEFLTGLKWRVETHQTKTDYGAEHIYYIEKSIPKIAVISANLGGFDKMMEPVPQSMQYDYFVFTDENFPPRFNAMTPRLQAKIPKCFGWQMAPNYDYYLWLDSTLAFSTPDSLKYFYDNCQGYDMVVFRHPTHPNVRQEARYTRKGIKQEARYIVSRYKNELVNEQYAAIEADKDFVDDALVNGGAFMYRNTKEVHNMLKEWWYHISRYIIQDQISLAYVLKKSGLKVNIKSDAINNCAFLKSRGHRAGSK